MLEAAQGSGEKAVSPEPTAQSPEPYVMGIHSAEAIVLRRYPFRETSVTLTCLTDQFGKLKGLVKGLLEQLINHRLRVLERDHVIHQFHAQGRKAHRL